MATKKATKRAPGRPAKSEPVQVRVRRTRRARVDDSKAVDTAAQLAEINAQDLVQWREEFERWRAVRDQVNAAAVEKAFTPTAADLIERLRVHMKGIDQITEQAILVGVNRGVAESARSSLQYQLSDFVNALLRAP